MPVITITAASSRATMTKVEMAPVRPSSRVRTSALGRLATMPEKMMSEVPLPTPRAVICSPSHIRKMVPPVKVTTVVTRKKMPAFITAEPAPADMLSSPAAMP